MGSGARVRLVFYINLLPFRTSLIEIEFLNFLKIVDLW